MLPARYQPLDQPRAGVPLRARDLETAQTVILRETTPLAPPQLEQALKRAHAAKGVFHPSLITLFDVQPAGVNRLLLAYEYVPAQTISQLAGGQPFNPRRAAEVMSEIADAVAELHARDIVHGAISASTVLVTMKGKAKLDRVADPAGQVGPLDDLETDLKAMITVLRELTGFGRHPLPGLDMILEHDDGACFGSAATLAASLRAAAKA